MKFRASIIATIFIVLAASTATTVAQDTKHWTLLHSFNGRDFAPRATVLLHGKDDGTAEMTLTNDNDAVVGVTQIKAMMDFGLYQLKLIDQETQSTILTSVPSCQVRQASFRDEITVTLNSVGSAISLTYSPLVSPLAPPCEAMNEMTEQLPVPDSGGIAFTSKIFFETAVPGMVIPAILPITAPQQGLKFYPKTPGQPGQPGQPSPTLTEEPKSFFMKYWYIILPLVIVSMIGPGAEAPVANGTPATARQPTATTAAPTVQPASLNTTGESSSGASPSKPQRRGKRN